jgi:hypothetical protein
MLIKNEHFELNYKPSNINEININKELYRGELYCDLLKNFIKSCLKNLGEKTFSHKKNYTRTITNMLSSWLFTLYQNDSSNSNSDDIKDPFFPTNYLQNDFIIERTLLDYCSLYNIQNINIKINNIIKDLHFSYEHILDKFNNHINTNNPVEIIVNKEEIYYDRNNKKIKFYNFKLINIEDSIYICKKLINIINNIMIPVEQYDFMSLNYNGKEELKDTLVWIILFRYQLLSSNNNQLAVLPKIYKQMEKDFDLSVECFASSINTTSKYYCSLYQDIEQYFGSIGNFFNLIPIKGTFSFNPPYQYDIITNGVNKIFDHLKNTTEKLTFIITIPIWDNVGKEYMSKYMVENNNNIINYIDFDIMNKIRESEYFRGLRMISKDDFTYMDHNFYLFKNKTIQNTYVIIMSNYDCNFINKINEYNFFE